MHKLLQKRKTEVFVIAFLTALFLASGYFSQTYLSAFTELLREYESISMLVYVTGATITTVIAPLSFLPVLPIAVSLWGGLVAAVLSIIAWSLGAAIAFLIARRYGRPLVLRFVGEEKIQRFEKLIPQKQLFLAVVFLRVVLPVDILSYLLGLMGVMRFGPYMIATVIGITPFAFGLAYLAGLDLMYQIAAFLIAAIFIAMSFTYMKQQYLKRFQDVAEDA